MAIEKTWQSVGPTLITAPGTINGKLTLTSTFGYKVKMNIQLLNPPADALGLEIRQVLSPTQLEVGTIGSKWAERADVSSALPGAMIFAPKQPRNFNIPLQEIQRQTYEEEPTVAWRSLLVDVYGNPYTLTNPFPSQITDGEDNLAINPDGSINVVMTSGLSKRIAIGFLATDWVSNQMICVQTGVPTIPGQIGPHEMPLSSYLQATVWKWTGSGYLKEVGLTILYNSTTGNITIIKSALPPVFSGVVYVDAY